MQVALLHLFEVSSKARLRQLWFRPIAVFCVELLLPHLVVGVLASGYIPVLGVVQAHPRGVAVLGRKNLSLRSPAGRKNLLVLAQELALAGVLLGTAYAVALVREQRFACNDVAARHERRSVDPRLPHEEHCTGDSKNQARCSDQLDAPLSLRGPVGVGSLFKGYRRIR
ncbi:hypothetical protein [Streptomyces adustus]